MVLELDTHLQALNSPVALYTHLQHFVVYHGPCMILRGPLTNHTLTQVYLTNLAKATLQ
jgi:hypothetical protein